MIRIKNVKLAILSIILIATFCALGKWQLARADLKRSILGNFAERINHEPLTNKELAVGSDLRFYRALLRGSFDNEHNVLLDNKVVNGKVGYELYTPFIAGRIRILVDRGFIPLGESRNILPQIEPIEGVVTVQGFLNTSPGYIRFGKMIEEAVKWPLRVEYLNIDELKNIDIKSVENLNPLILVQTTKATTFDPLAMQIVSSGPERHIGYAVQWFALAFTLLLISVALNCEYRHPKKRSL